MCFLVLDAVSGFPRPPFARHLIILIGAKGKPKIDYTKPAKNSVKRMEIQINKSETETHGDKIIN